MLRSKRRAKLQAARSHARARARVVALLTSVLVDLFATHVSLLLALFLNCKHVLTFRQRVCVTRQRTRCLNVIVFRLAISIVYEVVNE